MGNALTRLMVKVRLLSPFRSATLTVGGPVPLGAPAQLTLALDPWDPVRVSPDSYARWLTRAHWHTDTNFGKTEVVHDVKQPLKLPETVSEALTVPIVFDVPRDLPPTWRAASTNETRLRFTTEVSARVLVDGYGAVPADVRVIVLAEMVDG